MYTLYNILTYIAAFHVKIIALFNAKIKLGVQGRKETFNRLNKKINHTDKTIWFHCASLGEYEQGLPVFEAIKEDFPEHKYVLSFFSPSGYDIRKNTPIADVVVYLPLDTKKNAKTFIDLIHPELVIFVKYEIWPNYLNQLKIRGIKTLLISAVFRNDQIYFKSYGALMRRALGTFNHIFVQDEKSKSNLKSIGIKKVTLSGDTRFDRVSNQLHLDNQLKSIAAFKNDKLCLVAGSTWPEGEALLADYINNNKSNAVKYIIAPHNIKPKQISHLQDQLKLPSVLFSEKEGKILSDYSVLIIDSIGLLSKIYSYADIAYVGGAIGTTGLHNTLEPAVFGIPIIIGQNHQKFPEAINLINNKGTFSISNYSEFQSIVSKLINNESFRRDSGKHNLEFIEKNQGAVVQIMDYIRK